MRKEAVRKSARSRSSISAGWVLLGLFSAGPALAAEPDRCNANPACAKLTEQAAERAAQTQYDRALQIYRQAYELSGEPRLLINIGRCNYRLGRVRQALDALLTMQAKLPDGEPEIMERLQAFTADARQALNAENSEPPLPPGWDAPRPPASGTSAQAHPAPPPADRCTADPACQQISEQAAEQAAQTSYDRALSLYERAYARSQEPRLLLNIGRCYYRLGRAKRALTSFHALRLALPTLEPELQGRLEPFISEAKASIAADQTAAYTDAEPAPAPGDVKLSEPLLTRQVLGRPLWRVAAGGAAAGLGVLLVGLGAGALSAHGGCVTPSPVGMGLCSPMTRPDGQRSILLVDGVTPGVPLLVVGGALLVGGAVLLALPGREKSTAGLNRLQANATWLAR
jgi:tetratricopeptide (TPR) repeat protein